MRRTKCSLEAALAARKRAVLTMGPHVPASICRARQRQKVGSVRRVRGSPTTFFTVRSPCKYSDTGMPSTHAECVDIEGTDSDRLINSRDTRRKRVHQCMASLRRPAHVVGVIMLLLLGVGSAVCVQDNSYVQEAACTDACDSTSIARGAIAESAGRTAATETGGQEVKAGWLPSKMANVMRPSISSRTSMLARVEHAAAPCRTAVAKAASLVDTPGLEVGVRTIDEPCGWHEASRSTQVFIMLSGRLRLTEMDGSRRMLTKDDVLYVPEGHRGQWEVLEPISQLYIVMRSLPRWSAGRRKKATVESIGSLMAQLKGPADPLQCAGVTTRFASLVEEEHLEVGVYAVSDACSSTEADFSEYPVDDVRVVLDGRLELIGANGSSSVLTPGDVFFTPKGWRSRWNVIEPLSTLFIMMSDDSFAYRGDTNSYDEESSDSYSYDDDE